MLRLNSDLGESFGPWKMGMDEAVMPLVDMANIACGFHASDPLTMQYTLGLAKKHGVSVGAHPSYPDLVGFGRRSLACSMEEITALVSYQVGALMGMATVQGVEVSYIKPHGALYNDMMVNEAIFTAVAKVARGYGMKLMILSGAANARYETLAKTLGIELLYEVFADRAYTKEGLLVARSKEGAVLHSEEAVKARIDLLLREGKLVCETGDTLALKADALCVHGDNEKAVELVKTLRAYLDAWTS